MRISDWSSDVCSSDLLYDVFLKQELARQGFVVQPAQWRRAAHKCADLVYTRLTGEGPYFDSRIVYVSETGAKKRRIKRLAIMDQDGANHRFLTNGQSIVLTPRRSEEHTSELQSLMRISYAVFCLKKKKQNRQTQPAA